MIQILTESTTDHLPELPVSPRPGDCIALLPDGRRLYAITGDWREIPIADPARARPATMPLLADGVDLAGWQRIAPQRRIEAVTLPGTKSLKLIAEAEAIVQRDLNTLNFEAALDHSCDLDELCMRVHCLTDPDSIDSTGRTVVYDHRSKRFWKLITEPAYAANYHDGY